MTTLCWAGAAVSATTPTPVDPMVEGARQCTQYFPAEEQRNAIPSHLLAAISSTESGRWHSGLGLALPWPWTINVEGKGYYFDSKAEAIAKTTALMKAGQRSIDVGCMQVNLMHHPAAFASLEDAFDPSKNVAYAAKFLRANYNGSGDWVKATAAYHSRTAIYGRQYLGQIERSWNRIVSKVQQARAVQGIETPPVQAPAFSATKLADGAPASTEQRNATALAPVSKAQIVTPAASKLRPLKDTRNIRIIKVTDQPAQAPAKAAPILVPVTPTPPQKAPTPAPANATLADARDSAADILVRGASDTVRQVRLEPVAATVDEPVTAVSSASGGSHFVFAN